MHQIFQQNKRLTISNVFIFLSFLGMMAWYISDQANAFGMHPLFLHQWAYGFVALQFWAYQFLHGGIFHFFSNAIFLFLFGNLVENRMGKWRYFLFFLINTVFVGCALLFLTNGITIGISWFAMAILAYYMLELKKIGHPEYRSALMMLVINILIGFSSGVSLVWHLFGAIFGGIFWFIDSRFFR